MDGCLLDGHSLLDAAAEAAVMAAASPLIPPPMMHKSYDSITWLLLCMVWEGKLKEKHKRKAKDVKSNFLKTWHRPSIFLNEKYFFD
jgi:hypothetical protein